MTATREIPKRSERIRALFGDLSADLKPSAGVYKAGYVPVTNFAYNMSHTSPDVQSSAPEVFEALGVRWVISEGEVADRPDLHQEAELVHGDVVDHPRPACARADHVGVHVEHDLAVDRAEVVDLHGGHARRAQVRSRPGRMVTKAPKSMIRAILPS